MYIRSRVLLCLVTMLLSVTVDAKQTVRIAFIDVPPYAYQNQEQQPKGKLIERFKEIMSAIDMEIEFIHLPHRRLVQFIEAGNVDVWAGLARSRIDDNISFMTSQPLFVMKLDAYWKQGTPSVTQLADLKDRNTILISSYSYGGHYRKLAEESLHTRSAINHEDGFDQLMTNHGFYLLGYHEIAQQVIQKFDIKGIEHAPLARYELHLKMSKSFPNANALIKEIDSIIATERAQ